MCSHFNFQVASSESFQLPTLKQLIGHQSDSTFSIYKENIRATQPSLPPSLSLPLKDNALRRSFNEQEVVDIPIQIIDDEDDDPNKLLLLRVPQNKLNRAILHSVLKIKVIDPKSLQKDDSSELGDGIANTNLLTNELLMKERRDLKGNQEILESENPIELERSASTYRGGSNKKRRPEVETNLSTSTERSLNSQSSPIAQITQDSISNQSSTPVIPTTEDSLPVNPRTADIERARRRRIRLNSSRVTTGPIHHNSNLQVRRRPIKRRDNVDVTDSTTTLRITTSRGSTLSGSTTPDIPRGFFLTRNIDEILVTQVDKVSSLDIQSTYPSTISTTEKTTFSTVMEPFTNFLSPKDYSESSTVTNSFTEGKDEEDESNFFVTTTKITQNNEQVLRDRYFDDYFNPMETTTEIAETTIPKLDDVNDINSLTNGEIESITEKPALPHRYLRKKLRKIKPISKEALDLESFTTPSIRSKKILLKKINIRFSTEATPPDSTFTNSVSTFTNPDYTFTNPVSTFTNLDSYSTNPDSTFINSESTSSTTSGFTSSPTTLESTTFTISDPTSFVTTTNSITLATTDTISESILPTSEAPSTEQSTTSRNFTDREDPDFQSEVTEANGSDITTEDILLKNDDFIKPNSNFVELSTERPDSSVTKFYVDLQTDSYDEFEKLNFEFKNTPEIRDNDVTTEKGYDSTLSTQNQILNTETTPSSIYQINDQNETSIFVTTTSQLILPNANDINSLINDQQISAQKLTNITTKVTDELVTRVTKPTTNGRRRVLKRKRQRIHQELEEKHMEVAKTEAIEVSLGKNKDKSTTPATISFTNTLEVEKPSRKRVVVYRGTRRFTSRTTPSTTTVQSFPDTGDHQNQIVSQRRMRKVVRKRPKLSAADIPESELSTLEGQSNRKGKDLSLDPETKSLDDAEEAGSEVNVFRSSAGTLRRPGSFYHREPNRSRGRASNYQPLTSTQPTLRRLASPGRQTLHLGETALPSKLSFASVDDETDLLEHLARLEDQKAEMDDQANRAHEVELEDPETTTEPGHSSIRTTFWRKISTTETPKTLATTANQALRRRQGQKYFNKIVSQNLTQRPQRPAIVDYDYYEDEKVRFVGKPKLNGKLYVTSRGSISCLDQGNFPHPSSCKKFITCARMVNGLVVGTEYTCPDKLSFDPIGGICNWSAGLGCKE